MLKCEKWIFTDDNLLSQMLCHQACFSTDTFVYFMDFQYT